MSSGEVDAELFAISAPGLEPVVAAELEALGFDARVETGGVGWNGGTRDLYAANLHLRAASRILVRVARFRARSFIEMERHARRIDWSPFIAPGDAVRLRVTSRKSRLYHERAIEERFARFIVERVGADVRLARAAADEDGDDGSDGSGDDLPAGFAGDGQLFVVRFLRDECVVSADASGALLHRRGYRQAVAKAPLRETLAAAMLLAAGWDGSTPLVDPFCGSGTIPIEGALIARRIAPGLANRELQPRAFAFQRWPTFRPEVWADVVGEARAAVRDRARHAILGTDRDAGAVAAARANAERAGVTDDVDFDSRAVSLAAPPDDAAHGLIVTNPPYGVRVGDPGPLRDLYAAFGRVVSERFPGWPVAILAADDGLERFTGIDFEELVKTRNGGIPVRLLVGVGERRSS